MAITQTPKVIYTESQSNPTVSGNGAEVPIFIGITGNGSPTSGIQKFKNYDACAKSVANGGIGTDPTTNPLLAVLKDFFAENIKINSEDLCVPYIYVIDLGTGKTSDSTPVLDNTAWTAAMDLAKKKREVTAEVFVGFQKTDTAAAIIPIMESAVTKITTDSSRGNPRIAYFTVAGMNDTEIAALTDDTQTKYIQSSRVGLCEPTLFGKTLCKIFTTHYSEEPGYTTYRSVKEGTFTERTDTGENTLQAAGVIFNRDEKPGQHIYPKLCLAVSTSFAKAAANRPNDALLHARRNVDQLIRDTVDVVYPQLKRNETQVHLSYTQAALDNLVSEKKKAGYMMNGTVLTVKESETEAYDLEVEGVAVPVNATELINVSIYIEAPNTTIVA